MLCLCRVLLAAVVVSCTLSRSQANGPSTQRSDRIKDLMCVLLLSGMQKDDLDANVLNKLQRHNVNIHDLNNKKPLQDCTTYQYLHNENITPQINTIVTENSLNNLTSKINDIFIINNLTNNNINNNNNNFTKYEHKNKNNEDEIKYVDGQPELKSVLNFWKDIKIDNLSKITESPININMNDVINKNYEPEQKNKRNVPNGENSNESDTIQKLLVNFLLKNQNKNINKPVKMTFDNGDYNKVYLLGTRNNKKNTEINEDSKTADMAPGERAQLEVKAMPIKQYALINNPSQNDWQLKVPERDSEREKPKPNNSKNFNDILNALQSYFPIKSNDRSIESLYDNNKDIESIYFKKKSEREISFTTEKSINPKLIEQNISQNMIKEIANSVKDLVLNDLRKEIFKTTASYPTTEKPYSTRYFTTEREYIATTVKIENQHIEQSILNKFMDLFEEIKTLNHKTLIISSENKRDNIVQKEAIHNTYSGSVLPMINNGMVNTQSNYKTKQYLNTKSQKILNFSPQIHKFRSNAVSETIKQVPQKRARPITFQTNNMEIPPLGIPVNKPENPINQNIIVPTMRPYRIGVYGDDYEKIKSTDPRNTNGYIPKKTEIRILKSQEPTIYDQSHENDKRHKIINDRINYNTNSDDRVTLNRYKQQVHRGNGVKRGNIQRFHEKLERDRDYFNDPIQKEYTRIVDCCDERYAYSRQMVDCCNRKIASRQQMSLNHVKKHPSYDTHFNNFIKSQKKVTDMLERILASRVRGRSVETA